MGRLSFARLCFPFGWLKHFEEIGNNLEFKGVPCYHDKESVFVWAADNLCLNVHIFLSSQATSASIDHKTIGFRLLAMFDELSNKSVNIYSRTRLSLQHNATSR